jgi:hypothetical protein
LQAARAPPKRNSQLSRVIDSTRARRRDARVRRDCTNSRVAGISLWVP